MQIVDVLNQASPREKQRKFKSHQKLVPYHFLVTIDWLPEQVAI